MEHTVWIAFALFIADLLIRAGLSIRVIMRRLPVGVALAWLVLILVFPFVGALFYLLLGEYRLGPRRTRRAIAVRAQADAVLAARPHAPDAYCSPLDSQGAALANLGESLLQAPLLPGNRLDLLPNVDFEVTLAVYDAQFASKLRQFQESYLDRSEILDLAECRSRSAMERFAENTARLAGPVL